MDIDRSKAHCFITLVCSMDGVERGTGIPGLDELRPAANKLGFDLSGFEVVDPSEQQGPTALQPTLEKLRALRKAVDGEISEIECYGDDPADEDGEDLIEDLSSGASYRIGEAWRAYADFYERGGR